MQTGVYLLTQAVVLETAKLVGIGSGLTVLNLSGFIMSQLREQVKEINQKLDTILDAPLAEAVEFFDMAMIQLEQGNIAGTIEELKNVKSSAMKAFQYADGKGYAMEGRC